jgi:hypothetical protein
MIAVYAIGLQGARLLEVMGCNDVSAGKYKWEERVADTRVCSGWG